jgi:LPS sulfotransferase NodH
MLPLARADREQIDSYLICATPRTGSSLLCGLLDSTGVAGHPESWFRRPDEQAWAARWGIASESDGTFRYADYFRAAVAAGSTPNGVFAARIMWGTMDAVVANLAPLYSDDVYPDHVYPDHVYPDHVYPADAGSDAGLLNAAFGRTRFIYLRRGDVVAQAVSLLRAEQTGVWFETARDRQEPEGEPSFDFDQIRERVRLIEEHNRAWEEWFAVAGIQPYLVRYEELDAEPDRIARGVLDSLGLDLPAGREIAIRHKRLADEINANWTASYRQRRSREAAESLASGALDWLLGSAQSTEAGLTWAATAATASGDETDPTLYQGSAGIVLALLEAQRHFQDDRYGDAAIRGAAAIAAAVDSADNCSLYFGLTGMAVALHAVHAQLGDTPAAAAADRALNHVRSRFDGQRWSEMFELLFGNAGIALGALHAGDIELAVLAVAPYLRTADPTPGGVNWPVRPSPPRSHHIAHGTLGIVHALAAVGAAADRPDLIELALAGAADVVARNEAGPAGFLVPHSDPPHRPDLIERYSYGWCNGPAGDAQVFRLLGAVTRDPAWAALADSCWHTVSHCGLPRRVRPGFWDNNGRCCGTAGVLALACDRYVEQAQPLDFADVLLADLAARATADADGVRWSNHEHRATPSALEPRTGWAMGNAGIIRELLRLARMSTGGDPSYAVPWPDHPNAIRSV